MKAFACFVSLCIVAGGLLAQSFSLKSSLERSIFQLFKMRRIGSSEPAFEKYLRRKLYGLGMLQVEKFPLVCPDPESVATIIAGKETIRAFPLWPNGVQTSSCNITSTLVDGGDGSLHALDGIPIRGNIVLIDFNTGTNWRTCMRLGAKAILFVEPNETLRGEGECKWSDMPVDMPRFFVRAQDVATLRKSINRTVSLRCSQTLRQVEARNYFSLIPGTDPELKSEIILLSAYADTISVVPGLPHGADQSSGLAALFEVADWLKAHPPKRTVILLVTEGHFLAMQGVRNFLEARFQDNWAITNGVLPQFSFTFDLSTGTPAVCPLAEGWWMEYRQENKDRERNVSRVLGEIALREAKARDVDARSLFYDGVNVPDGRDWRNSIPGRIATESEIFNLTGQNCITFATMEDSRSHQDTPFDTPERMNFEHLATQTQTIIALLVEMVNDTQNEAAKGVTIAPFHGGGIFSRLSFTAGFGTVSGQTLRYDPSKDFLPSEPIPGVFVEMETRYHTYMGIRGQTVVLSREGDGRYFFYGVPTSTCKEPKFRRPLSVFAFGLNQDSRIVSASDISQGYRLGYEPYFMLNSGYMESPIVLFNCKVLTVFGAIDPLVLKPITYYFLMNANNHGTTRSGSYLSEFQEMKYRRSIDDVLMLFVNNNERFSVAGYFDAGEARVAMLNPQPNEPSGAGYKLDELNGTEHFDAASVSTTSLLSLNEWRLQRLRKHHIVNPGIERLHRSAQQMMALATAAEHENRHSDAARYANAAWGLALREHPLILSVTRDVLNGLLFYLALLLPCSYLLERLLIASKTIGKQLLWCGVIFCGIFVMLMRLHPAFDLTSNSFIIFIAFALAALSLVVIVIILNKFEQSLKTIEELQQAAAAGRTSKFNLFFIALAIGLSNLRRRKARTILTSLTLTIVTLICLSFTSLESEIKFHALDTPGVPRYDGILMRNYSLDPIDENAFRVFANEFDSKTPVARRVWYFGGETSSLAVIPIRYRDKTVEMSALMGVDREESSISHLQDALMPNSNWFGSQLENGIILPSIAAKALGIRLEDIGKADVQLLGMDFRVIGLSDESKIGEVFDLDNECILPADFRSSDRLKTRGQAGGLAFRHYLRLDPSKVALIRADVALNIGGDIRNVAAGFRSPAATQAALDSLMVRSGLNLYATALENGHRVIKRFSAMAGTSGTGFEYVILPVLMAGLAVLNTMIASVIERKSEISILSSIGLSPRQIGSLFFSESLVYAILGCTFGYLLAQIGALILRYAGSADLNINYSSGAAVFASLLVAAVVLLSTIAPAKMAVRVASPSGAGDWTAAEPEGDEWRLKLPFTVSLEQARGLARYYENWFSAHSKYSIGNFVTEDATSAESGELMSTTARCWLRPFDLGVQQTVDIRFQPTEVASIYQIALVIERISGDPSQWVRVNTPFLSELRQQFLEWRTLGPERQARFAREEQFG